MCHFNCQTERTVLELKQKLFPSLPQMHEFLDSRREMKEHTDRKMIAINKHGGKERVREDGMQMVGSAAEIRWFSDC